MSTKYMLEVNEADNGDCFIEFPQTLLDEVGWKIGDTIDWKEGSNGEFILTKTNKQWVLVECVNSFRIRYMVQVPEGKSEWALDTVVMEEAKEFSQKHLGETIVSHRVMNYEDALKMCDEDNDYIKSWDESTKVDKFFTAWEEQND